MSSGAWDDECKEEISPESSPRKKESELDELESAANQEHTDGTTELQEKSACEDKEQSEISEEDDSDSSDEDSETVVYSHVENQYRKKFGTIPIYYQVSDTVTSSISGIKNTESGPPTPSTSMEIDDGELGEMNSIIPGESIFCFGGIRWFEDALQWQLPV